MIIRFSNRYEILPYDRFNWGVFEVMPEGFDNQRARYRLAEDGRALRHIGTYHATCAEACRKAGELLFREGIADPECEGVARACDEARMAVGAVAEAIGAVADVRG